ncbi:3-demethylubiquinone-9 3-methyltransferase [Aspergillus japonicus CBS 114.51]|uniref:Ubiquinone biosynthesis O-methyltransferase, mitochondrial n=2 Tax=Aspergillus TaxID=5052 RepID=A0A2V5HDW6_ASPV1|nr:3-demethylubiquinone-9 3-methyltransferase [Aspergillus japonicus CBS 114.51]PYI22545.1 3-demethylubiquinone-9 3-methyltransferase [Aspergillus violaceofuscus CBS 115571]RAH85670.1 3-demethylubiquinone-9 3-methyltransferase [Aspergillus japonicus CBS 114.51]
MATRRALRTLNHLATRRAHSTSSVSANELSHFSALASSWWDPQGPSRVLHLMNPLRHDFIASCLSDALPPSSTSTTPNTLRYLDIGCGGGIFAESLARSISTTPTSQTATPTRAAAITAIDPSTTLIQIARDHARLDPTVDAHLRSGRFEYKNCTLEDLIVAAPPQQASSTSTPTSTPPQNYDIVTLFEVIEHIESTPSAGISPQSFLADCLRLVRPGGWLIGSTIARTFPSWLVNQVIAEAPWPIGVVPRGTHEWQKFVNPEELEAWVQEGLMRAADGRAVRAGAAALEGMRWKCVGVVYFPGFGWKLVPGSESWGNYFWAVRKGV